MHRCVRTQVCVCGPEILTRIHYTEYSLCTCIPIYTPTYPHMSMRTHTCIFQASLLMHTQKIHTQRARSISRGRLHTHQAERVTSVYLSRSRCPAPSSGAPYMSAPYPGCRSSECMVCVCADAPLSVCCTRVCVCTQVCVFALFTLGSLHRIQSLGGLLTNP